MLDIEINFVNLENLCDDWGFKENEIIDAHNMLRSTQANLAVLEGKIMYALLITYLQKEEAYAIVSHIGKIIFLLKTHKGLYERNIAN